MKLNQKHTIYASYIGYITQAIINNLPPLLFIIFRNELGISLDKIGLLISINFGVQILVDFLSAKFVDKIGYRISIVVAHIFCTVGLVSMGILPLIIKDAYLGLVLAMCLNAIGGGIIEVLISPIVESVPGDAKDQAMSLLHSFYCWGHVSVVLLTTLFFAVFTTSAWRILPILWAFVPFVNIFYFSKVPLFSLVEAENQIPLRKLFKVKVFWILFLLMICSGASEQAMSQWSSLFAEIGVGVSKTMGDLLGPCFFAVLMGASRVFYGVKGEKIELKRFLVGSSILCVLSYLLAVFSPIPILSLMGCAMCGLSVGIMWPGCFSLAAKEYPAGGTGMFAFLALAGDLGCSSGPGIVGMISEKVQDTGTSFLEYFLSGQDVTQLGMKTGLLVAIAFPILLIIGIFLLNRKGNE